MSYDIWMQDIPDSARTIEDIPDDFIPADIGLRSAIIHKIKAVVPFADFSDPSWGNIDGPGFSIEVNLGEDEKVDCCHFIVRGSDMALAVVADILADFKMRAFAPCEGGIFKIEEAEESLQLWRAYRAQILAGS